MLLSFTREFYQQNLGHILYPLKKLTETHFLALATHPFLLVKKIRIVALAKATAHPAQELVSRIGAQGWFEIVILLQLITDASLEASWVKY